MSKSRILDHLRRLPRDNLFLSFIIQALSDYLELPQEIDLRGRKVVNRLWLSAEAFILGFHQRAMVFIDPQSGEAVLVEKGQPYVSSYMGLTTAEIVALANLSPAMWQQIKRDILKTAAEGEKDATV
jgi:hypothetical protein